ncbi:hypothetical protein CNR22_14635 [Sphingobacteriaceae bacterium]|nr:hypothetical protein CNR22_14635 [Sphingobacteriaceae bacterium]
MKSLNFAIGVTALTLIFSVSFISCKKEQTVKEGALEQEPNLPVIPYDYASKHVVENNIATLGRVLFYDKNLSVNNQVSCGSCHKQEFAFADNVQFNKGFNGINLKRNSPSIQGIRGFAPVAGFFQQNFNQQQFSGDITVPSKYNQTPVILFWDGRQNSVSDMVLNPVLNHNEMNVSDFEALIAKLNTLSYYPNLFIQAFGDAKITTERIAYALEAFLACLNSEDPSKTNNGNTFLHEHGISTLAPDPNLTPLEEQGRQLFHTKYNCATCHDPSNSGSYGAVTSPSQMFNIGLDEEYSDNGLGALTKKEGDKGLFKVPTLKNISLTAPYMHDGRFKNLGEVIDHYSHNIKPNRNLSGLFVNSAGAPKKLNILPTEKSALIAFLNSLKDEDFLTNPMYSDPFKK